MSLLLDTHFVFGLADTPNALTEPEARFLQTHSERFVVSAISLWEIRLKWNAIHRSGSRKGPISPAQALHLISGQPVEFLPLWPIHTITELRTPIAHKDPFDELLLTQAQVEGLKLLSRDEKLSDHPLVTTIN
jgi:PIN domain nuclease of toxin-antitoxin system